MKLWKKKIQHFNITNFNARFHEDWQCKCCWQKASFVGCLWLITRPDIGRVFNTSFISCSVSLWLLCCSWGVEQTIAAPFCARGRPQYLAWQRPLTVPLKKTPPPPPTPPPSPHTLPPTPVSLTIVPACGLCLLSKVLNYVSAWKSGNSFPLIRHRYHSCDLGKSSMLSAQFYTLCIQALWSDENYNIVRSRVQSKSKYYIQNKILSLHSWLVKGWQLWTQIDTL